MVTESSLVLSANARPGAGGQGLNLEHMIGALEGEHRLEIFCQGAEDPRVVAIPPSLVAKAIGRVPVLRRRKDWLTLASDLHFDRAVARRLPKVRVFQGVVGQCAESLAAARARGMGCVLDVVNQHVDALGDAAARESRRFGLRSFIHPRMRARILEEYARADRIRVMCERARRSFLERGFPADKLFVATPPIDVDAFPKARFEDPVFRVVFVGLIEPWKGFHHLVEAFASLGLKGAELVLWGGPGARSVSRYLAEWQARCPGLKIRPVPIRTAGLDEVFGKASVLVHPSLSDGFSYAVAEAMASGLPVIVTDATGAADLVEDGVNGYVVPAGDPEPIRARLAELHAHRERLPALGANARAAAARLKPEAFRGPLLDAISALR